MTYELLFRGDDVAGVMSDHDDVVKAVLKNIDPLGLSKVTVEVSPAIAHMALEWTCTLVGRHGRKTLTITQRAPNGTIFIEGVKLP